MVPHSPVTLGSVVVPTRCIGITVRNSLTNIHLHYLIGLNGCAHAGIFPAMRSQVLCPRATAASRILLPCSWLCVSAQHRVRFIRHTPPVVSGHRFRLPSIHALSRTQIGTCGHACVRVWFAAHSLLPLRTISYHCLVCVSSGSSGSLHMLSRARSAIALGTFVGHTRRICVE